MLTWGGRAGDDGDMEKAKGFFVRLMPVAILALRAYRGDPSAAKELLDLAKAKMKQKGDK